MMFLSFVIGIVMITWSGYGIGGHVLPARERLLRLCIALPIGALVHALILAFLTIIHVPLHGWILIALHAFMGVVAIIVPSVARPDDVPALPSVVRFKHERLLQIVLVLLLAVQCGYAAVHAVVLPTYHIDSLTNWTMRAKVSWQDNALAFDETEERGVSKPQYPFLVHGLQMAASVTAPTFSDRGANAATLLLTLSSFGALFVLLKKLRGTTIALMAVATITHIPLVAFHLAQGYGDIHLLTYLLLAMGFVIAARVRDDTRWYVASGLFVAAAAWTKTEGIIIGLIPWLLLVAVDLPFLQGRYERIAAMITGTVGSAFFPLFLLIKGLPFTPHASDGSIGLQSGAIGPALAGFLSPSMGLTWPAILVALIAVATLWRRNDPRIDCRLMITLGWGILALFIVLATYTLTPNARFLLNGESYYRQLLIPAVLLILSISAALRRRATE